ncbi:MAG: riboflavin synthase [Gammaproteobacteria bacterium]|nr:riboflavin synthase [Gammaproteobacteria bacterium]MCW5583993.1 riboflavin synthase [Gammaproteobacteria bacterium]
MFSGIVETTGLIIGIEIMDECKNFLISPITPFTDLTIGESISVNGVCLTLTHFSNQYFSVTAVPETLKLTNLDMLDINHVVNLERSIKLDSRLGGHYVQGHVDGIGKILEIFPDKSTALLVKISIPKQLSRYIVNKGYITLDGMSITVIQSTETWFTVTLIPHTQEVTIIKQYSVGTLINIEVDILGKYVEKLLGAYQHAIPNKTS